MDKLIFGDKEGRKSSKKDVEGEGGWVKRDEKREEQAEKNGQGVKGMADPFKARQSALQMEDPLIEKDENSLEDKGEKNQICFRKTAPASVSPGPKARLTIKVPFGTVSSSKIWCQMWGRVADDMFPYCFKMAREKRSCSS